MWTRLSLPLAGVAGYLVGLVWMIWIYRRSHLEPGPPKPIWRYKDPRGSRLASDEVDEERDKLERARAIAREMIISAILLAAVAVFVFVAQPGHTGGGMFYEPPWYEAALPWAAAAGYLVGLVWMIWIYRRSHLEPEPDDPIWRYRS
jgi:hypothetical protein